MEEITSWRNHFIKVSDTIKRMIGEAKVLADPITEESDLYADLGFDSLGFVALLMDIEQAFSIEFALMEMSLCLNVGRLIALTQLKLQEPDMDSY